MYGKENISEAGQDQVSVLCVYAPVLCGCAHSFMCVHACMHACVHACVCGMHPY